MEEATQPKDMLQEGRPNHQPPRTPERIVCIEEQVGAGEGTRTELQKGKSRILRVSSEKAQASTPQTYLVELSFQH